MKVVIQRVLSSSVEVDNKIVGKINEGLTILVGFSKNDTYEKIDKIVNKIIKLRIFDDNNHIMNKSILDIGGSILSISQFTLYANVKKGNRPSYIDAMKSSEAEKLYDYFNNELSKYIEVKQGIFGSNMKLNIENNGPVTIIIEEWLNVF